MLCGRLYRTQAQLHGESQRLYPSACFLGLYNDQCNLAASGRLMMTRAATSVGYGCFRNGEVMDTLMPVSEMKQSGRGKSLDPRTICRLMHAAIITCAV